MRALRESAEGSAVVFLDCSFETCYERIRSSDRPLVRANTREQLYEIFLNRQQRYREVADLGHSRMSQAGSGHDSRGKLSGSWQFDSQSSCASSVLDV